MANVLERGAKLRQAKSDTMKCTL